MPFRCRSVWIMGVRLERQLLNSSPLCVKFSLSSSFSLADPSLPVTRLRCSVPSTESVCCSHNSRFLRASAKLRELDHAKGFHGRALKFGFCSALSLQNETLGPYEKGEGIDDTCKVFDEMLVKGMGARNVLISGLVRSNKTGIHLTGIHLAFSYFRMMMPLGLRLEAISLNALIHACTELSDCIAGRELHCLVVKQGFGQSCFICTALVDFYGKCGLVEEARKLFEEVARRDIVLWNVIISSCVLNGLCDEALDLHISMLNDGFKGDAFTYSSLLKASAHLKSGRVGKRIHGLVIKLSFSRDVHVASSLVHMYAESGDIRDARKCFYRMEARNVVAWNAIIVGYGRSGDGKEAAKLLREMLLQNFRPDELTLASVLSSCGNTSMAWGMVQVHALATKIGLDSFPSVVNSLINAYSKCGNIASALLYFGSLASPDIISWTSIVTAFAFHGSAKQSIETFHNMLLDGNIKPDSVAFLGVLSACTHAGHVTEGLRYFNMMVKDYGIEPDSKHFTCLVDLLGRGGHLDEAFEILAEMSTDPSPDALAAFLSACNVHGNRKMARWAAEKLVELGPNKPVNCSLLSNMYSSEGRWHEAAQVRAMRSESSEQKVAGHSWIEVGDNAYI